jgi:hypothetical protein
MSKKRVKTLTVLNTDIRIVPVETEDYISLTDMLKAKDGDFFIALFELFFKFDYALLHSGV